MIEKRTIYLIVYSTYFTPSKYSEGIFGFFSDKSLPEIVSISMPIGCTDGDFLPMFHFVSTVSILK